jgi:hypothetical protein
MSTIGYTVSPIRQQWFLKATGDLFKGKWKGGGRKRDLEEGIFRNVLWLLRKVTHSMLHQGGQKYSGNRASLRQTHTHKTLSLEPHW